ncbi:UNVERIFIED_CONTAM: hypothetical protein RMT77_006378 [Armadillidium vulgare]
MIHLHDQGISNAEIGRRLGLARQTVSTVTNSKEKILKDIKSATPVNTKIIRKRDYVIAEMEKVLVLWIEDQTSHNVPLSHVGKRLLNDITFYTEILREGKRCSMKQTSLTSYFKPVPQIPAPSNPIIQQPSSIASTTININARLSTKQEN